MRATIKCLEKEKATVGLAFFLLLIHSSALRPTQWGQWRKGLIKHCSCDVASWFPFITTGQMLKHNWHVSYSKVMTQTGRAVAVAISVLTSSLQQGVNPSSLPAPVLTVVTLWHARVLCTTVPLSVTQRESSQQKQQEFKLPVGFA